ncbi:FkbM family methyltransferase [Pedobacter puniceum]|uniref:FkbM family methyltransferase n=1 Tax=Pedobacter puniceum TaxID=2666136 RepID=A0A7K0FQ53_9SPHI|nr:FkbM family methyltransferase [Pedobacter puniceum]MRX47390.1 FkbM family methyltransferase [Pedobacter puniceum]
MNFLHQLNLKFRAFRYQNKTDKGGIKYILENVKVGDTVLDIGAHKGGYLYFIKKQIGEKGKVYAFEPQISLFNYLVKLKAYLGWNNVFINNVALSNTKDILTLRIPIKGSKKSSPGASLIDIFNKEQEVLEQKIQTLTLDEYCQTNHISPKLLKIDVEGNELEVLLGGIETLKKYSPKLIIESEERHVGQEKVKQVFNFLQDLGYKGFFIKDTEFLPLVDFSFEKHQNFNNKPYCNNFIFEKF